LPKQHLIANLKVKVVGERATSRCICLNPQGTHDEDGQLKMLFFGLWYEDTLIYTEESGWKIKSRTSKKSFATK
jgi:hypothetical protein